MPRFLRQLMAVSSLLLLTHIAHAVEVPLTAAVLSNGALQLFATGPDHQPYTAWLGDTGWSSWVKFGKALGSQGAVYALASGPLPNGELQVFAVDALDQLDSTWKVDPSPGAAWATGVNMSTALGQLPAEIEHLAAAPLSDGRLQLWAADSNGTLFTTWKATTDPGAVWTPWLSFSQAAGSIPGGVQQIAVAPLSDGRLQLWAADGFGRLYTTWKVDTSSTSDWTQWVDFFGVVGSLDRPVKNITVAPLSDGRLQLWALDDKGVIYTTRKVSAKADADWSQWDNFSAEVPASQRFARLSAVRMGDGRVALTATNGADVFVTAKVTSDPQGGWTDWQDLPLPPDQSCHCSADGSVCQCRL